MDSPSLAARSRGPQVGLFAGSFDPIHLGHLDVIERAAGLFDALVVATVSNPEKNSGMLSLPEREMLIARATCHLPNVRTVSHYGLTIALALDLDASALVRACGKDATVELAMAAMNLNAGGYPTVLVPRSEQFRQISSSTVRAACRGGDRAGLTALVPAVVIEFLEATGRVIGCGPHVTVEHQSSTFRAVGTGQ